MVNHLLLFWSGVVRRARWFAVPALPLVLGCSTDATVGPAVRQGPPPAVMETTNYSFSITPANHTVHVRFARVRPDGEESVSDFMRRVFASADAARATRLVLDLSAIRGGDAFLLVPLVKGILARDQFTRQGGLVVVVGPNSFSPSQSAATILRQYAQPVFVDHPVT